MAKDNGGKSAVKKDGERGATAVAAELARSQAGAGRSRDSSRRGRHATGARRCSCPRPPFPCAPGCPTSSRACSHRWAEMNLYERLRQKGRERREVPAARRAALRQRQHPHRPRAQQDPQGSRRQIAGHARLRFQLRAGLGLPRPADRVEDRGELPRQGPQQGRGADQRVPRRVPRVRRALDRRAARGVQAPRRRRRLGASLQDHGLSRPRRRSPAS